MAQTEMQPSHDSHEMDMKRDMAHATGIGLDMTDPQNPMNWPLPKKLYASAAGFFFTLTL